MKQLGDKQIDILFYGPFGTNIPPERAGGAETGCRRSVELLKKHGVSVHIVEKPTRYYGAKRFMLDYIKAVVHIIKVLRVNRGILFYLVGFYDRQLPFEVFLCMIAKGFGCRLIYEPKNGQLVKKYEHGGRLYRRLSDYIFQSSDNILCQGVEYQKFLQELGSGRAVYHPNYVSNDTLSLVHREKNDGTRNFIYFGRVTPSKNVDLCLEIFRRFHETNGGSQLYIIGGAEDDYLASLKAAAVSGGIREAVHFTGCLPFGEIAAYLNRADYFLFPSGEEFEGHSNSLTEAMAFGVVPVASSAGFNRAVIGEDKLVVDTKEASDYLKVLFDIEEQNLWSGYSGYARRRVRDFYSEDIVKENYLKTVEKLISSRDIPGNQE